MQEEPLALIRSTCWYLILFKLLIYFHARFRYKVMVLTLTLHKFFSSGMVDMLETVAFSGQMLDA